MIQRNAAKVEAEAGSSKSKRNSNGVVGDGDGDAVQDMIEREVVKKDGLLMQTLSQFICVVDKLNQYVTHPNQRALQANAGHRTAGDLAAQQAQETEAGLVLVRIYLFMCTWGFEHRVENHVFHCTRIFLTLLRPLSPSDPL